MIVRYHYQLCLVPPFLPGDGLSPYVDSMSLPGLNHLLLSNYDFLQRVMGFLDFLWTHGTDEIRVIAIVITTLAIFRCVPILFLA